MSEEYSKMGLYPAVMLIVLIDRCIKLEYCIMVSPLTTRAT
jgi:hypothetical protein